MKISREEYLMRLKKVKDKMSESNIDVLLISDPANMNYLTGYNAWSFYVHQMVIIDLEEEEPIWIGRNMDGIAARAVAWIKEDNIISYDDEYVQNIEKHPMDFIANFLVSLNRDGKNIAVEMDNYWFSAKAYNQLVKGLPNSKFVDANGLVNWIRIIKSETELEMVRRAGKIMEKGMKEAINYLNVGVRECDMAAKIYESFISGTEEYGGDYASIVPLMPSGDHTGACHLTWTERKYKENEVVIFELAGCYNRYHSPMSRTIFLGKPSAKISDVAKITVEGLNKALEFIKEGVYAEEVEKVWSDHLKSHGLFKESRIGYSTGLNYPPDWGEHTLSLRPGDKTILKEGMVLHCIPGMYYEDFGVEISEAIIVKKNGVEVLADVKRELIIK